MKIRHKKIEEIALDSWSVSWPMALIMFFIFLIGLCDVYVAGRFGKEFQAAYGLAFQVYFIFGIIAMAFTVGSVSVISRLFTSDSTDEFRKSVSSSVVSMFVCGLVVGIIAFLFSEVIIKKFNISNDMKVIVVSLMKIYSVGLLFNYMLINTNGILRACGMIRKSLFTMIIVCFLNVGLNFFLAFKTSFGFTGIAVATVVSTCCGSVFNLFHARRLHFNLARFSASIISNIIRISWPAGMMQVLWQLGAMALFYILSALPRNNIETMAAFTNGLKIEALIFLPAFAFNMANAVLIGNLLGRKEKENAFSTGIVTASMGVLVVTGLTVIIMINARTIASFLSDNALVVNESIKYIYISLLFEPMMAWGVILGGGLSGAGDTKSLMVIVVFAVWLVRIPLSYISAIFLGLGAVGIWWSMNASIIFQTVFITRRYFRKKWIKYGEKAIV